MEKSKEINTFFFFQVQQRLAETDRRAIEAEHRARESEEQVQKHFFF